MKIEAWYPYGYPDSTEGNQFVCLDSKSVRSLVAATKKGITASF